MNDDEGRFGVVGGRGDLAFTVVDKHTHEWVQTFENPTGRQGANDRAWKLVRRLNRAWREEKERREAAGVPLTDPWVRPGGRLTA